MGLGRPGRLDPHPFTHGLTGGIEDHPLDARATYINAQREFAAVMGRNGCLMANHGMVVGGANLNRAMWLAGELEALAHQYYHALTIGGGQILSDAEIEETARGFESYGVQSKDDAG